LVGRCRVSVISEGTDFAPATSCGMSEINIIPDCNRLFDYDPDSAASENRGSFKKRDTERIGKTWILLGLRVDQNPQWGLARSAENVKLVFEIGSIATHHDSETLGSGSSICHRHHESISGRIAEQTSESQRGIN
jgi:hypothetical protein